MILSNISIHKALDNKWLIIDPEPSPRRKEGATNCPYNTTAIDLRLASEIAYFKEGLPINIDLARGSFANLFGPNSRTHELTDQQPYSLNPGKLVLGKTLERVELPLTVGVPCLAARVEGKSSYARRGLLVHFTAPTIHAGFRGTITLELINLGPTPILLRPGTPICQLIVEQVDGVPFRNDGQFQNQSRAGGQAP